MNSVRLWKCLFEENVTRSSGVLEIYSDFSWEGNDFTVRGLENYIFSSSKEMNRHRDLYNVAVLQYPYDSDGMLACVCEMSRASLQRAQNYALHAAIDSYECSALAPAFHRIGSKCRRFPPMSRPAVLSINQFHHSVETMNDQLFDITNIREMNKRLIKQHLNIRVNQDLSPARKKLKRRSSTTGSSYALAHETSLTNPERRRSTSFLDKDSRQPVSLQMQNISSSDRQRRRLSMVDDFNQHMQFCDRLVNELPIIDHSPYRRDTLSLNCSGLKEVSNQVESTAEINNRVNMEIDDENLLQRQIRRDSLCGSRRGLRAGIGTDTVTSTISSLPVSTAMKPANEVFDDDNHLLLPVGQMLREQEQSSLNDSAFNEYTNYIRSYSRLRRDSLGGNFGI